MSDVTITPTLNGPYEVTGEVTIIAPDGTILRETAKSLPVPLRPFGQQALLRRNPSADRLEPGPGLT